MNVSVRGASRQIARHPRKEQAPTRAKFVVGSGHAAVLGARTEDARKSRGGAMKAGSLIAFVLGGALAATLVNLNVLAQQTPALGAPPTRLRLC